ncbi:RNA pseudouridylate synthase [Candidatus Rhabdochlamydia oedothoracis]|uniref:RNA pseudouridylate synthase n=1 Tax=Candidatus Rhabdochlamydia oedothoracis TaxID=2720720 RepID=A0ABX8V1I2_9BACT|nr:MULTISPECIES: RluA family pseudouridine synthase [Rhabdochlamydia]KAG6559772.1 Ribosomal large subunit pseudouridine synthase C [Candidatus Rhabdochlamydia sp. W815]QYF49001.1 RNA pseudouridylate synthase [Candidatus Rhabdochlamydia oedothoracis]
MKKILCKAQLEREYKGMSLLAFLRLQCTDISVKSLKSAIDTKLCTVNGIVERFSTHPLKIGDVVILYQPQTLHPKHLEILYQDEHLLICNKPAMLISDMRSLQPLLKDRWLLGHRLDKETSGALIFVKNKLILQKLIALFKEHSVEKFYLALVDGQVLQEERKIDKPIAKLKNYQGQSLYGVATKPGAKRAVTLWRCLKRSKTASLLLCQPMTGRTHQLRVHLSYMGYPILGDTLYAKHFFCRTSVIRHLLHAYILRFPNPISHQIITVKAKIPEDFKECLKELKMTHAI